ncbi:Gti1/Pac2 family-domain-containing protein [Obelidium mucronatum]|nr:Gti1/Pac2 family-domain-containing protein [Obelidium mucronatum]
MPQYPSGQSSTGSALLPPQRYHQRPLPPQPTSSSSASSRPSIPYFYETFRGFVKTKRDAQILIEACVAGHLSPLNSFPVDMSRMQIKSGTVIVFAEHSNSTQMMRWRDGGKWSPSRINQDFLLYREVEAVKPGDGPVVAVQNEIMPQFVNPITRPNTRLVPNGFAKRTITLTGSDGKEYRVISYFYPHDVSHLYEGEIQAAPPADVDMLDGERPDANSTVNLRQRIVFPAPNTILKYGRIETGGQPFMTPSKVPALARFRNPPSSGSLIPQRKQSSPLRSVIIPSQATFPHPLPQQQQPQQQFQQIGSSLSFQPQKQQHLDQDNYNAHRQHFSSPHGQESSSSFYQQQPHEQHQQPEYFHNPNHQYFIAHNNISSMNASVCPCGGIGPKVKYNPDWEQEPAVLAPLSNFHDDSANA